MKQFYNILVSMTDDQKFVAWKMFVFGMYSGAVIVWLTLFYVQYI